MNKVKEFYTREEVDALKGWYDNMPLPESLQLDKAVFIPSVRQTVDRLFRQAYLCYENPKLLGGLRLLERIKEKLGTPVG